MHCSANSNKRPREVPRHRDKESLACPHLSRGAFCAKLSERDGPGMREQIGGNRLGIFPTASSFDQGAPEETGDGFRQLSRTLGPRCRERQTPRQAMAFDAKLLKELRPTPHGMF